jgi:serine/threonine-protein kinase
VWSTNRRRSVHDGIASNESSYAAETADRVVAAIDVHANAWAEARKEACLAAEVREEPGWSEELYQRSLSCFDTRRSQLQSLLDQLDEADALTVQRAPFAVADLADPQLCADAEVVRTLPIPPPQSRAQVEAIMAELHRSTALRVVGSYGEAQTVAEQALQRADELGWAPLVARAEAQVGRVWVAAGNDEGARDILETAHYRALGASDYDTALRTAGDLAALYGVTLSDYAEGRSWLRHAETALSRLPDPAGLQRADIEATRGAILHAEAKYAESRQVKEAVLQQYTASLGAEHPQVAMALQSLANDDQVTGDYQRAEELYGRALEVFETALGPEHPEVAKTMANLALVEKAQGRYVEARERYEDALRLLEPALGPDHPDLGVVLTNLGLLLEEMGEVQEAKRMHERALKLAEQSGASPEAMATALHNVAGVDFTLGNYDESRAMFERVIGILERELGPRHPRIAAALQNLGLVADSQGDTRYAYDTYGRALEIVEEAVGPDHPTVADLLLNLASIDMAEERYDLGRQRLDRAIEIESAAFGPDHPSLMTSFNNVATLEYRRARYDEARPLYERARDICRAHPELDPRMCSYPLYGLARVALAQGRPDDALPLARRAFEMRVDTEASATELADVRFALAKALWETRTDRGRAVRLARQAADEYREEGTEPEALADVETWLRRHRHPT